MPVIPFRSRQQLREEQTRIEQAVLRHLLHLEESARDLAAAGHSDHTISAILKLDLAAVRQLIGQRHEQLS